MDIRHITEKGFGDIISTKKQLVYDNAPVVINLDLDKVEEDVRDDNANYVNQYVNKVKNSPLGDIAVKNDVILPLNKIHDFKVKDESDLAKAGLPVGMSFSEVVNHRQFQEYLRTLAEEMFPEENPLTDGKDIDRNAFYTPSVPLVILTKAMTPQYCDKKRLFNPEGTVSVAEFLDSLNAIYYGYSANNRRKKTIDNISIEEDYFNEGYQDCIRGLSSPFFNLYTREELMKPITRLELAYITVICWNNFISKFNNLYGGKYYLGINIDWENPHDTIINYEDGAAYQVSYIVKNKQYNVISLNIKDYKECSMTEYKEKMKAGEVAIPLPMYMSMLELGELNLFYYTNNELNPLREVTRGELSYFIDNLARIFK